MKTGRYDGVERDHYFQRMSRLPNGPARLTRARAVAYFAVQSIAEAWRLAGGGARRLRARSRVTEETVPRREAEKGRFAYEGLDRVIHGKARLALLTALLSFPKGLPFSELKRLCALTDGNLSRHLAVLQEDGLIAIDKRLEENRPLTTCRITSAGRKRFSEYLKVLERLVDDAGKASAGAGIRDTGKASP